MDTGQWIMASLQLVGVIVAALAAVAAWRAAKTSEKSVIHSRQSAASARKSVRVSMKTLEEHGRTVAGDLLFRIKQEWNGSTVGAARYKFGRTFAQVMDAKGAQHISSELGVISSFLETACLLVVARMVPIDWFHHVLGYEVLLYARIVEQQLERDRATGRVVPRDAAENIITAARRLRAYVRESQGSEPQPTTDAEMIRLIKLEGKAGPVEIFSDSGRHLGTSEAGPDGLPLETGPMPQ